MTIVFANIVVNGQPYDIQKLVFDKIRFHEL